MEAPDGDQRLEADFVTGGVRVIAPGEADGAARPEITIKYPRMVAADQIAATILAFLASDGDDAAPASEGPGEETAR